jgi:hypothetical protein
VPVGQQPHRPVVGKNNSQHMPHHDGSDLDERHQGSPSERTVDHEVRGAQPVRAGAQRIRQLDKGGLPDEQQQRVVVRNEVAGAGTSLHPRLVNRVNSSALRRRMANLRVPTSTPRQ